MMSASDNKKYKIKQNARGVTYIIMSALGFSLIPILAQIGLSPNMTSSTLLFYRFAIAGIIFLIYCLVKKKPIKLSDKKQYLNVILAGFIYSLQCIFFFSSFNHISSSLGEIIFHCYPLFVLIMANVFLNEAVTINRIVGVCLSIIGIGIVLYAPWNITEIRGILYVIAAAFISSLYMVFSKKRVTHIDTVVLTMYLCIICSIIYFIFSLSCKEFLLLDSKDIILNVLVLAVFSTVIGFFAFMKGISLLPVGQVSILSLSEPIFTIILAYIFLSVELTWMQITGTIILLLAVYIYDRK